MAAEITAMGLDYWDPDRVVNFRDAGEWVNLIAGRELMPRNHLLRGGTLQWARSLAVVGHPRTIFNLQGGADPEFPGVVAHHFAGSDVDEKYQTAEPEVRRWLVDIVGTVAAGVEFPLYVHCLSGKDRTGVVVASLLHILGIPEQVIVEEYLLSDSKEDLEGDRERAERRRAAARESILGALNGIGRAEQYFRRCDLAAVRGALLSR